MLGAMIEESDALYSAVIVIVVVCVAAPCRCVPWQT
jgi:hypothetical protein